MNVTTLPNNRQRTPTQGGPPSGGRTAERSQYLTDGATALAPQPAAVPVPRRGPAELPPRLRVAPPVPVTAPRAPFVALVLVLVIAGVVGILVLNTKIAENAFRLDDLHKTQSSLDREEQRLQSDLAEKESPAMLAAQATRLGLGPSRTLAFIVLPDGRTIGVPGPAGTRG